MDASRAGAIYVKFKHTFASTCRAYIRRRGGSFEVLELLHGSYYVKCEPTNNLSTELRVHSSSSSSSSS